MNPPNQQSGPPQPLCRAPRALCPLCPCLLFSALCSLVPLLLRAQTQPQPAPPAFAPPPLSFSGNGITDAVERLPQQTKPAKKPTSDEWAFTFLPPGLSLNPQNNYTILTEITKAGRMLPEPSVAHPVYYIAHSMNQHDGGDHYGFQPKVIYDSMRQQLAASLASNGYLPYAPKHPEHIPTQVLFFTWGLHNRVDMLGLGGGLQPGGVMLHGSLDSNSSVDVYNIRDDSETTVTCATDEITNLLARAKVVGGQSLAEEVARRLRFTGSKRDLTRTYAIGYGILGPRNDIADLLLNDCYYMHVTAYDLAALERGQRDPLPLLWITRVSTISLGIVFKKTLPIMIGNSAYYFGRETDGLITLRKRAYKKATVTIGDPTVVEYMSGTIAPATTGTSTKKP